ncbi:transcription and mRNA export factor ENY2-like isoform X1 [Hibiscus syriacus]|uniref:transcription and mRNA export factor ENY2-like isoform X1 n=1 Tax=Hibiscus syriacus TaxID=106335 RepID=UPI0019237C34|nr:transcription and mRNA export factor ENY2-like isoform X1 [Hibiscus syriacus]
MKHSVNRPPTPDAAEDQGKEPTLQEIINIKLIESGEKERLMELLRERLIDCGWKDEMKAICRLCPNVADMLMLHFLDADGKLVVFSIMIMAYIKKKGRNNVTVDDLVHLITPKGRASVPDNVKADLLQRIRTFLMSAAL